MRLDKPQALYSLKNRKKQPQQNDSSEDQACHSIARPTPLIKKPSKKISQGTFAKVHAVDQQIIIKQIQLGNGNTNGRLKYAISQKIILDDCIHPSLIKCFNACFIENGNYGLEEQRGFKTLNEFIGRWNKYLAKANSNDSEQLDIKLLIYWMIQLILGLIHLSQKQILHRDIKLNNIVVFKNGQIKFIDFGISQYEHFNRFQKVRALKNIQIENHIENFYYVGTCGYFAPEISMKILESQYKTNYHRDRVRKYNYYVSKVSLAKIMKEINYSQQTNKQLDREDLSSNSAIALQGSQFLQNNMKITYQTEVWALGVVFYTVLYQKKPFGDQSEEHQFFEIMLTKEIQFKGLDEQLYNSIYQALYKDSFEIKNHHKAELMEILEQLPDIAIVIIVIRLMLEKDPKKRLKAQHILKIFEKYIDQAIKLGKLDKQYDLIKLCKIDQSKNIFTTEY